MLHSLEIIENIQITQLNYEKKNHLEDFPDLEILVALRINWKPESMIMLYSLKNVFANH